MCISFLCLTMSKKHSLSYFRLPKTTKYSVVRGKRSLLQHSINVILSPVNFFLMIIRSLRECPFLERKKTLAIIVSTDYYIFSIK